MDPDNRREETKHVESWQNRLNAINLGWEKGDLESQIMKTADLVNHSLAFVIELKTEFGVLDNQSRNIEVFSNKLQKYFNLTCKKFNIYPHYKSILVVEINSAIVLAQLALGGIVSILINPRSGEVMGSGVRNQNLYKNIEQIGAVIFWPNEPNVLNAQAYYFDNPFAAVSRKITLGESQLIVGGHLEFLEVNTNSSIIDFS